LWDPVTGRPERVLEGHTGWVAAVCAVPVGGRVLLASAGDDGTVRLWDPVTGLPERVLEGHTGPVSAVCAVPVGGRVLLASAGGDRTVRLWDPATGQPVRAIPVHHPAHGCASAAGVLVIGLTRGLLALRLTEYL
jgi:WD40 repeat protein